MKKYLAIFALCAILGLTGCAGAEESGSQTQESTAQTTENAQQPEETVSGAEEGEKVSALGELAEELKSAYPDSFPDSVLYGSEVFEKNCKKLYACEADELTDGMVAFSRTGAIADEVSVVYPADGDTVKLTKMLEARKETRWNDFNGYAPDELPKIEAGRVFTAGGAAVLVISDDGEAIEKLVREKLGG